MTVDDATVKKLHELALRSYNQGGLDALDALAEGLTKLGAIDLPISSTTLGAFIAGARQIIEQAPAP